MANFRNIFSKEFSEPCADTNKYPPSKVTTLGYADLSSRIKGMLEHGRLVAQSLTEEGEYDEDVSETDMYNSDIKVDDLNDISLDKIDVMEKADEISSRILETRKNLDNALSELENKKSSEMEKSSSSSMSTAESGTE